MLQVATFLLAPRGYITTIDIMSIPRTSTLISMAISKELLAKVKREAEAQSEKRGRRVTVSELIREPLVFKYGGKK